MRLLKVTLENFLTYESLEYNIPRTPLLVQGKNLTEEDQESNGSGKSGIFTAIEFCIAGTNSRGCKDKELVMFGQKQARITLEAQCDVRKQVIKIDWLIKIKGSNILHITLNDKEVSFSNVNDGKKFILNWFAIEKEDLFNYYIINKQRFKSFFVASNKEKVDLINRFSDASIIDGLDKLDNSDLELELSEIKARFDKTEGKIELLEDQIEAEQSKDVEADAKLAIEDLEDDILDIQDEIKAYEEKLKDDKSLHSHATKELQEIKKQVISAEQAVQNFVSKDFSTTDLETEQVDLEAKELKVDKLLNELDIELSGTIECPSCSFEFILDSKHGSIEDAKSKQQKATAIKEQIETAIDKLVIKIDDLNVLNEEQEIAKKDVKIQLMNLQQDSLGAERKVLKYQGRITEGENDVIECNNEIAKIKLEIKELKGAKNSDNSQALKQDLSQLRLDLIKIEGELNDKNDEIYKRNKWKNNFKQFRMHLANQSLEAIEFHMNRYLKEMGSDLKVKMEGFKMLSNGTFKDEITAKIIRNVERSFSSFSGGEQGRLLFAAILANRHMLNSTHPYGGLDFLSVDEVFEGVDSLGLKSLVKSAKLLDIAVMIITHVTDEEVNDDILLIEKINGVSYVKS